MKPRMLCTDCFETSHPATLLPGSDRVELAGWLCFALPGWLYCAWRHAVRVKACGVCGGHALVREARAAAARAGVAECPEDPARVRNLGGPASWPRPFATPRERLHAGAPGAVAALVALLGGTLAVAVPAQPLAAGVIGACSLALTLGWLLRGAQLWRRTRARLALCRAWLPDGREIHIELV